MYDLHTYAADDGFRWGVVAENHLKVASGGQGYSNFEDMENVLLKLYVPARGAISGIHVPWTECVLHNSKQKRCYVHKLIDARTLAQSLREAVGGPLEVDPSPPGPKQR